MSKFNNKLDTVNDKVKGIVFSKAFRAIYGRTVEIISKEEAELVLLAINDLSGMNVDTSDFFKRLYAYEESEEHTHHIRHIICNTVNGDRHVCVTVDVDGEEAIPPSLDDEMGVFCYVYNVDCKEYSQFGYCFFEKAERNSYRRVG